MTSYTVRTFTWYPDITPNEMFSLYYYPVLARMVCRSVKSMDSSLSWRKSFYTTKMHRNGTAWLLLGVWRINDLRDTIIIVLVVAVLTFSWSHAYWHPERTSLLRTWELSAWVRGVSCGIRSSSAAKSTFALACPRTDLIQLWPMLCSRRGLRIFNSSLSLTEASTRQSLIQVPTGMCTCWSTCWALVAKDGRALPASHAADASNTHRKAARQIIGGCRRDERLKLYGRDTSASIFQIRWLKISLECSRSQGLQRS